MNTTDDLMTETDDAVIEARLAAWDEQQRAALDAFARAWDAHSAMIRRRTRRVRIMRDTHETR